MADDPVVPAPRNGICQAHPFLLGSLNEIKVSMKDGFTDLGGKLERGLSRVHERLDEHLEHHHKSEKTNPVVPVVAQPDSDPRLPTGIERTNKWLEFVTRLAIVIAGTLGILYLLWQMAEKGIIK